MFNSKVLLKDGIEEVTALQLCDKDNIWLSGDPSLFKKSKNSKRPDLCIRPIFLDTETSHNHDEENPKAWIYQFAFKFGSCYFTGRKPSELCEWLLFIRDKMELNTHKKVVVYVHNLSYDMQYLKHFISKHSEMFNVLALKAHKILQVETDHFIFKCSYLLSNRGLDAWCKATNSDHVKAVGTIDYDMIRYQDDELTEDDWFYQLSDVASMSDCWDIEGGEQFDIQTIPLTSTGFVRYDGRKLFKEDDENRKKFQREQLSSDLYMIAKDAFMGGYTHGNRHYAGKRLKGNIKHYDYRSFYPSATRCDYFPSTAFSLFYKYKNGDEYDEYLEEDLNNLINNKCCLMTVMLTDGTLDPDVTAPILSAHKVLKGRMTEIIKVEDNGRILEFTGTTVLRLTELDYKWVMKQYDFEEVKILEMWTAERDYLPKWVNVLTDKYFLNKNTLKEIDPLEYAKSKAKLNAIYGMFATALNRDEWIMDELTGEWSSNSPDLEEALSKYYNSRNSFMSYQYGVYVTAHCRDRLLTMIEEVIGYDNFIYADTDSAFFFTDEEINNNINEINRINREECIRRGAGVYNDKGEFIEYMAFEDENDDITEFKFLHAKCYGMISKGKLAITIAGVTSKWRDGSGRTREEELGDLDNLEDGFVFEQCGGTSCFYTEDLPTVEEIDGHITEYASACIITDVNYTIKDLRKEWILDVESVDL